MATIHEYNLKSTPNENIYNKNVPQLDVDEQELCNCKLENLHLCENCLTLNKTLIFRKL